MGRVRWAALKPRDNIAALVYVSFLVIWVATCLVFEFCNLCTTRLVWIAFGFGIGYQLFTGLHASYRPLIEKPEHERKLLKWITQYLTAFVLAITLIMLVGVQLSDASVDAIRYDPTLRAFYSFEFLALGFVLLFVFPTYWFGPKNKKEENWENKWLRLTRHIKTASYLAAIFFCLAGVVELATYLLL